MKDPDIGKLWVALNVVVRGAVPAAGFTFQFEPGPTLVKLAPCAVSGMFRVVPVIETHRVVPLTLLAVQPV
jgi:hypothetical protein